MMQVMITTFKLDIKDPSQLKIKNKGLIIIFIDKVVKILHLALMHPQDYTVSALKTFLFEKK